MIRGRADEVRAQGLDVITMVISCKREGSLPVAVLVGRGDAGQRANTATADVYGHLEAEQRVLRQYRGR